MHYICFQKKAITYKALIESLKKKDLQPVYLLHGTEPYYIDSITKIFEKELLSEAEQSFNLSILYGKEVDFQQVLNTVMRAPMMSPYQVVILKEAQVMRELPKLKNYIDKAIPSTIFVIAHKHKRLALNTALGKAIKKKGTIFESNPIYDNQVGDWIQDYIMDKGYTITPKASDLLGAFLGTDLGKIANELEKLMINLPKGTEITETIVQDNVGISKEYNVFELIDALAAKDSFKANRICQYFAANPKKNPFIMVLSTLYGFFSKVYIGFAYAKMNDMDFATKLGFNVRNQYAAKFRVRPYRAALKQYSKAEIEVALHLLMQYDLRSKGVNDTGTDAGELLKELVNKILSSE